MVKSLKKKTVKISWKFWFFSDDSYTETEMLSFWWNFNHWLHRKLSFWQLSVQPVMKISSKWRHFCFSVGIQMTVADYYTLHFNKVERGGYTGFTLSVCQNVRLSVRPWTESYPLCISINTRWIHFIFTHLIKQLRRCVAYKVFF